MARRHHTAIRGRTPYPTSRPGNSIALVVPQESDLSGAVCTVVAPEVFFPDPDDGEIAEQLAKRICLSCPVRMACLDRAIRRDERAGVFGGMTTAERDALTGRPGGCGTRAGYTRHVNGHDRACRACRAANAADTAARRAAKKARLAGQEGGSLEAAA